MKVLKLSESGGKGRRANKKDDRAKLRTLEDKNQKLYRGGNNLLGRRWHFLPLHKKGRRDTQEQTEHRICTRQQFISNANPCSVRNMWSYSDANRG